VCAVVVSAADVEGEKKPKKHKKHHKKHHSAIGHRCNKGWLEVGNSLCCPKDHPTLVDSTCYAPCPDGTDDMTLGAWVGCRDMCEGGYSSSINECTNGILTSQRKDHSREGVAPVSQASIDSLQTPKVSICHKGWVSVKQSGHGVHKHGGCCPESHPRLIMGKCYDGCESGREEIVIGNFVGCRAHCPEGWDEHTNDCSHDHQNNQDRGDFPRDGYTPHDRLIAPKPKATVDDTNNKGCSSGYVGASKHYCCPATQPILIDLLCYERCRTGYEESRYGCRKLCPTGWTQTTLNCGKGARSKHRKGYERHPKPSKMRST